MQFDFNHHFRAAGLTNPGQLREKNEDNFLIDAKAGLLVVADGMGGHQSGELASADAIRIMQEKLAPPPDSEAIHDTPLNGAAYGPNGQLSHCSDTQTIPDAVKDGNPEHWRVASAIAAANEIINGTNLERGYGPRDAMGTTVVGLYLQPDHPMGATIFHVGDSRFYRFRDHRLEQITRDHSAYENWLDDGGNGPAPGHHILSQAIGPTKSVVPGIQQHTFQARDVVLLCSDGLTDLVSDSDINGLLAAVDSNDLSAGCHALVDAAQSNGGTDNITVVLGAYLDERIY